jgi:hypothetical protein
VQLYAGLKSAHSKAHRCVHAQGARVRRWRYMEEIANGSAYEGHKDMDNTEIGYRKRFKGV